MVWNCVPSWWPAKVEHDQMGVFHVCLVGSVSQTDGTYTTISSSQVTLWKLNDESIWDLKCMINMMSEEVCGQCASVLVQHQKVSFIKILWRGSCVAFGGWWRHTVDGSFKDVSTIMTTMSSQWRDTRSCLLCIALNFQCFKFVYSIHQVLFHVLSLCFSSWWDCIKSGLVLLIT